MWGPTLAAWAVFLAVGAKKIQQVKLVRNVATVSVEGTAPNDECWEDTQCN